MDEVDEIIFRSLRQLGCEFEDDVLSLKDLSTEQIVEGAVKCLKVIKPDQDLSERLSPNMSMKIRQGLAIAQTCTDIGYQGEIGYQTFLYSGEQEIRKVFMFLVEKLPREIEKTSEGPINSKVLLEKAFSEELRKQLAAPWYPTYCNPRDLRWTGTKWARQGCKSSGAPFKASFLLTPAGLDDLTADIPKGKRVYYDKHNSLVTEQVDELTSSLFEHNSRELTVAEEWETDWSRGGLASHLSPEQYKLSKQRKIHAKVAGFLTNELKNFEIPPPVDASASVAVRMSSSKSNMAVASDAAEVPASNELQPVAVKASDVAKQREDEINELRRELEDIQTRRQERESQIQNYTAKIQKAKDIISELTNKNKTTEQELRTKQKALELLPDADGNVQKLQAVVESSAQRLVHLATQWEKHRAPLIQNYRELKEANAQKLSETQRKLEEIRRLREQMRDISENAKSKEELYRQLAVEYDKMPKDVTRSTYTRRILEIVTNIKKQKQDINNVLVDTRDVQKDINLLSAKLDRTFAQTDELIFRDAKRDEAVKKAYKYLAALHENCSLLMKTVEDTGAITRQIRDLEDQIENESQKKVYANLERITADFQQMKQENANLAARLNQRDK